MKQKTLLVIDDNEDMLFLFKDYFEGHGFNVITSNKGEEAIKSYTNHPTDFVLTDIIMPEKDGLEVILELKTIFPDARIMAMTGDSDENAKLSFQDAAELFGACATFTKPCSPHRVLEAIQKFQKD